MTVKEVYVNGQRLKEADIQSMDEKSTVPFFQALVLCNDSKPSNNSEFLGDPTETALTVFAAKHQFHKKELDSQFPRVNEIPFDSNRKCMTTIHMVDRQLRAYTKGAPDMIVDQCAYILRNGQVEPLLSEDREAILSTNRNLASEALRILAIAYRDLDQMTETFTPQAIEKELVFIGLVGMIDPPREEAVEAVRRCVDAGIRPIMITGDHRDTAVAIAKQLKIIEKEGEVITGSELAQMSEKEFVQKVANYSVYARVSPEHKVFIVNTWKRQGKVIAMTGDGVNDAPALKESDIGIGMGITGTDVAKGASDMVLADDNFATIVVAVEEGRKIYSNLRKSIQFLLSSNLGEVVTLFVATMLNWTILLPIHILWVNLVTDTLPALAIGMEKAEPDLMKQKPRKSKNSFFSDGMGYNILYQGFFKGLLTLISYYWGMQWYSHEAAMTIAFATLGLIQLTHTLNVRSNTKSIIKMGFFTNKYLNIAIIISAIFQLAVIIVPAFNSIFHVVQLTLVQWGIVLLCSLAIIPIVELVKFVNNKKTPLT